MSSDILHIKSLSITYTSPNIVVNVPSVTLTNGQVFELILAQPIPTTDHVNTPVVVTIGSTTTQEVSVSDNSDDESTTVNDTTNIPMLLQMGNNVRKSNLANRRRLICVYGNDPVHITVLAPCLR